MGTAAAIIIRKEKDLVAHLRRSGAVSAATAKPPGALGVDVDSRSFHRLRERAVIREATPGTWYLDEPTWNALWGIRRRVTLIALILIIAVGIVGLLTGRAMGGAP
jgi:hypothetical protein